MLCAPTDGLATNWVRGNRRRPSLNGTCFFAAAKHSTALGVACGAGAALFWAVGFVAARQGVDVGMSPLIIAVHRFLWPGLVLLPLAARDGFGDIRRLGWPRAFTLASSAGCRSRS